MDFGSAGMMIDPETGKSRRAHAFVMTLSCSRLPYVEFVFDQGQATWVKCHMNAFEFFEGVPVRIILDNLKSGILRPNTYDPVFNRAYGECAKHFGFIIDPAKIARGEHKGKVERKIPVVRQQFLAPEDFRDIREANNKVRQWSTLEYGMQVHGTTKRRPFEVFKAEEQQLLKSLPEEKFEIQIPAEDHRLLSAGGLETRRVCPAGSGQNHDRPRLPKSQESTGRLQAGGQIRLRNSEPGLQTLQLL